MTLVTIALGTANVTTRTAGDADSDGAITDSEIVQSVNNVLTGWAG